MLYSSDSSMLHEFKTFRFKIWFLDFEAICHLLKIFNFRYKSRLDCDNYAIMLMSMPGSI